MNARIAFVFWLMHRRMRRHPNHREHPHGQLQRRALFIAAETPKTSLKPEFVFSRADHTVVLLIAAIEQYDLLLTFSYTTRLALVAPYWVFAPSPSSRHRDRAIVSKTEFTQGPWKEDGQDRDR